MTSHTFRLLVVGVGGHGVLSTARVLGTAGMKAGLEVRVSQHHGLAQRGGSVEASLVVGPGESGFVSRAEADVVLALEPLEGQRAIPRMSSKTVVVVEPNRIIPYSLTSRGEMGPSLDSILEEISRITSRVLVVNATEAAREAGSSRALNVAMLGVVSGLGILPIPAESIVAVLEELGHSALEQVNVMAFERGRELGSEAASGSAVAWAGAGER